MGLKLSKLPRRKSLPSSPSTGLIAIRMGVGVGGGLISIRIGVGVGVEVGIGVLVGASTVGGVSVVDASVAAGAVLVA